MKISVENGNFAYHGSDGAVFGVLSNIAFSAGPGDILAILGPNGAGKTTLLRCMMGFLRWAQGRTLIDGRDLKEIPHRELWSTLSYVPQAKNTQSACTAGQMVLLGRSSHFGAAQKPSAKDLDKAGAAMEKLGISNLAHKKCSEISGGELQMVLIARALASEPEILILDEPESNLDFRNQLLVLDTISSLAREGMTCIFNTHYPAHALQRANRSLLLCRGGEYTCGDTAKTVTEQSIEKAFGVKAVIGDIETPGNITRDVVPLSISGRAGGSTGGEKPEDPNENGIAVITVIFSDYSAAARVNEIFHGCSGFIIGRMGMPFRGGGASTYIINVTLCAPKYEVYRILREIGDICAVSAKATFAPRGQAEADAGQAECEGVDLL
jgi:iron complex transport system ATP-binding protein